MKQGTNFARQKHSPPREPLGIWLNEEARSHMIQFNMSQVVMSNRLKRVRNETTLSEFACYKPYKTRGAGGGERSGAACAAGAHPKSLHLAGSKVSYQPELWGHPRVLSAC